MKCFISLNRPHSLFVVNISTIFNSFKLFKNKRCSKSLISKLNAEILNFASLTTLFHLSLSFDNNIDFNFVISSSQCFIFLSCSWFKDIVKFCLQSFSNTVSCSISFNAFSSIFFFAYSLSKSILDICSLIFS